MILTPPVFACTLRLSLLSLTLPLLRFQVVPIASSSSFSSLCSVPTGHPCNQPRSTFTTHIAQTDVTAIVRLDTNK